MLLGIVLAITASVPAYHFCLRPRYSSWSHSREEFKRKSLEHLTLSTYLERRDRLSPDFDELCSRLEEHGTEQASLSNFLKTVEQCARYPSLTISGMNPLPMEQAGTVRHYRVKLLISAALPDLIRFVSDMTCGSLVTGIDSFRIRAADGGRAVECSITLSTVRFLKARHGAALDAAATTPVTESKRSDA